MSIGWLGLLARPLYAVTGFLSMLGNLVGMRSAKKNLRGLKLTLVSPVDIVQYYHDNGFKWKEDPKIFGVTLEWARAPWVTFKKRYGDCEDLMLLSEHLLKVETVELVGPDGLKRLVTCGLVPSEHLERWAVRSVYGEWHAVLIFQRDSHWCLFSNLKYTIHQSRDDALRAHYGQYHSTSLRM